MNPKTRKRIFFWIRIAIALIFIATILLTVDLAKTWEELRETELLYVGLAAAAYLSFLGFLALRWLILSRVRGHPYGFFYLYRSVLIHMLFNNVLPTTIGGDVYRIMDTSGHKGKSEAFSIVWTDRLIGLIGTFLFASLASVFYAAVSGHLLLLALFGGALLFAVSLTMAFLSARLNAWLSPKLSRFRIFKYPLGEKIAAAFEAVTTYRNHKTALLAGVGVSLGVQICLALIWYFLFLSLKGETSFIHIVVTIPVVNTLAMFSVGGWGLREQTFVQMLATFAVAKATALATSLLFDVVNVFFGLMGGMLLLFRRGRAASSSET